MTTLLQFNTYIIWFINRCQFNLTSIYKDILIFSNNFQLFIINQHIFIITLLFREIVLLLK